jgi:hypothetical protein
MLGLGLMLRSKPLFITIVLCALSILASTQDKSTLLVGFTYDSAGATIANADVHIHWNCARSRGPRNTDVHDVAIKTDNKGRFEIKVIPGFYDVCAYARGFSAKCETIPVTNGLIAHYSASLAVSPAILQEFGDDFFRDIPDVPTISPELQGKLQQDTMHLHKSPKS